MKKIVLFIVAVAFATVSQAQFVLGGQAGYYMQESTTTTNIDKTSQSYFVGCLQLGYKVTPELYVGVSGGFINASFDTLVATDVYYYETVGMDINVTEHNKSLLREGWVVSPQVKYEFLRFGNMHLNLLLQGSIRMLGPRKYTENFITTTYPNPNEYREVEPYDDAVTDFTWGVSLRPTLVYEFSEHLSAELMLDLLSIGYMCETETYDPKLPGVDKQENKTTVFYAGLNSFTDVLRWENSLLKLGFNWTF